MATTTRPRPPRDRRPTRPQLAAKHALYRRTRDPAVRAELVLAYESLARSLAARFEGGREAPEDLVQAAMVGLLHAIDRFEPAIGVQFTTFAWATITGELKRHLRDRTWRLRVPRRSQELYLEIARAGEDLAHELGRPASVGELARRTGRAAREVAEALTLQNAFRLDSLDAPAADGGVRREVGGDDGGFGQVEDRNLLHDLLERLSERDRAIVRLRFGMEMTQSEIAQRVGLSQMQVSRLLEQILSRLRALAA